jgi:RNA polymerase sigma factor (sigma-70 family)
VQLIGYRVRVRIIFKDFLNKGYFMETQLEDLSSYITMAKKIISKFAPGFYSGLRKELLSNEDAIADIASAIMIGDWRWDKNRVGFNGQGKTQYSYRNQCGIWAIKTYLSNKYKKQNIHYSIDNIDSDTDMVFADSIQDKVEYNPSTIVEEEEHSLSLKNNVEDILNSGIISDKQKEQIKQYYFEDKTLSEIGKEFGVTREAVRQNINKGIAKIKSYV